MSKLEELIEELCPNGVKLKKIEECADYTQPSKFIVSDTNYVDEGIPVLTPGQSFILGYTTDEEGIFEASKENPIILFDDFTGSLQWVDFPFKVKSSACKIITSKKDVNIRYLYHLMANLNFRSDEHKRLWISIYSQFEVPIPPLPVQEEIVRILDNFTDLTAELQAELQARAKQYEYYTQTLLNKPIGNIYKLGEIATIKTGRKPDKIYEELGQYEYINAGTSNSGYVNAYNCEGDTTTTPSRGQGGIGFVGYQSRDFWLGPLCYRIKSKNTDNVLNKYIYYYLKCFPEKILQYKKEGGTPSINASDLINIDIIVPSREEQEKIVTILNSFESLTTNISEGLPAEIEARQKQYEYYRNKLLTFKELGA